MSVNSSFVPLIALVGSPNCGKTALFNALTGSRQKVANYAGVTVERKEGLFLGASGHKLRVLDLPGTYSLRARSPDEEVTRDVILGRSLLKETIDIIVCVSDATNLHLGLRLVLELKKVGKPIVLALNMMDVASSRGYEVDLEILSREIGVPVIPTVAIKKNGILELVSAVEKEVLKKQILENKFSNVQNIKSSKEVDNVWSEQDSKQVRYYHKEVERILCVSNRKQGEESLVTKKLDKIFLHPVYGLLSLFLILFFMFQAVFSWAKILQDQIQLGFTYFSSFLTSTLPSGMLSSLLTDGIITGVGSVLVFIPQIITLFLFILILEDSGYMARAAFLMDKLMGGVGLHGRAFIPLLSSFACAIPGIMSTRTIENKKDRMITILVAPLMTCSARLPVYTLIIATFIPANILLGFVNLQGLVMFALYATGISFALIAAFIMKTFFIKGGGEPLLMELPTYKLPRLQNILYGLYERALVFIRRAGSIILAVMILIWFLSSFPTLPQGSTLSAIDYSFAGRIGHFLQPLFAPIGFSWQMAVSLIPGMAAREACVGALATIYAVSGQETALKENLSTILSHTWALPTALSFLVWYIFAPQCISTLAVTKRETNSWRYPIIMFVYMISLAYLASFVTFRVTQYFLGL